MADSAKELRREKEQFDGLFDLSLDAVIMTDDDFHVLRVNKEFTRIFGYTAEEAAGQGLADLIVPEELHAEHLKHRASLLSGKRIEFEGIRQRKNGLRFEVSVVAKSISIGFDKIAVYLIYRDITEYKEAKTKLERSERALRDVVNTVPAHVWSTSPEGQVEFVNDRWLQFTGLALDEALGWKWESVVHPDDRTRIVVDWRSALENGRAMDTETRVRRADGKYCWWFIRNVPLRDETGKLVRWYGTAIDIEDRKQAEQALRKSEERWRSVFENSAIGVSLTDPDGGRFLATNHVYQAMLGYTEEELRSLSFLDITPEEYHQANRALVSELLEGKCRQFQMEKKYSRKDGSLIWVSVNVSLVPGTERVPRFFMALSEDITERKRAEESLRRNEAYLAEGQRLTKTGSWGYNPNTERAIYWSEEMRRIFGLDPQGSYLPDSEEFFRLMHPDDRDRFNERIEKARREKADFVQDYRIVLPDGTVKHIHGIGHPVLDETGNIVEYVGTDVDVSEQHEANSALQKAFEQIQAEEIELRRMVDAIATYIFVLRPDGTPLYANQTVLDYSGFTLEELQRGDHRARILHPEDVERLREERQAALARGMPFENEQRGLGKDGKYRWFLVRYNPLRDDHGNIIRWYATGTDIEDRKQAEERMRDENLALREQIDQAFMFEEIVGSSPPLQNVLSSILKVAPTDSTVLITGETGTGKELIARAIHKHSQRSGQAFISVNCASIPASLIASELFGHEKGAFTGAVQRRQGRFELAHSGTIFLDEVGDLPAETQVTLLRVLQERQFERVGGNRILTTDVRVLAATNRDLTAAIAAGTFRSDLFYRLNVFPIEVPALRKRKEDVPILVEYFVKRYAEKLGKQIRRIDKNTLELCQSYSWPGNIRELQNIVERSVILSGGDIFRIEKAWLASPEPVREDLSGYLPDTLQNQERGIIETALAESKGKVAGPEGAAAKLGIPRSTLDSKIKQLKIKKRKFASE
ncbi:MAG TPA: PAS domain S-box protein [Candidatus Sulfotelmatobacter sp.]|jgi:PAS domain S-box-containing protein